MAPRIRASAPITASACLLAMAALLGARASPCDVYVGPSEATKTIADGQAALQKLVAAGQCTPVNGTLARLNILEGTYYQAETLKVGAQDSGSATGGDVVWRAYPAGAEVIVSGGAPISGWSGTADKLTATVATSIEARMQLYTSGAWRQVARSPRAQPQDSYSRGLAGDSTLHWAKPLSPCDGSTCPDSNAYGFVFNGSDISPALYDLQNVSVLAFQSWTATWARIRDVFPENRTVLFRNRMMDRVGSFVSQGGKRYVLLNVREGLDEEGEFYWDALTGQISYLPTAEERAAIQGGGKPDQVLGAVRPVLDRILSVEGASFFALDGLRFQHATDGGAEARETQYYISSTALQVTTSKNITMRNVHVGLCGGSGVVVGEGMTGFEFASGSVKSVGGEGLSVSESGTDAKDVWIHDSVFNDTGRVFMMQPGIARLRGNESILFEHNVASYGPYGGVLVGWMHGSNTPTEGGVVPSITVRRNVIEHYGLGILSDFGGLYVSSDNNTCFLGGRNDDCAVPLLVEENLIRMGSHYNYGSEGFYADEQVSNVNISSNIFDSIGDAAIFNHCGARHWQLNNLITRSGRQRNGAYIKGCNKGGNPTWPNLTHGFVFDHNVLQVDPEGSQLIHDSDYRATSFDFNVYFASGGGDPAKLLVFPPGNASFSEWQRTGNDTHSLYQVDPEIDSVGSNWTLRSTSPALKLGFQQIPWEDIGPRRMAKQQ